MDNFVHTLAQDAAKGNFEPVNAVITNKEVILDDISAAKIVIECCRTCVMKDYSININEEELYKLLTTCIQSINSINGKLALRYLQSISCILNYFVTKKNYGFILKMKRMLFAEFIDFSINSELREKHSLLLELVRKAVDKFLSETADYTEEMHIQLYNLMLKMCSISSNQITTLANTAYYYFQKVKFKELDTNLQYGCFLYIFELIEEVQCMNNKTGKSSETYIAIMKVLELVVANLLRKNEFTKVNNCINIAVTKITKLSSTQKYLNLCDILQSLNQFIMPLKDEYCVELHEKLKKGFETCIEQLKSSCRTYGMIVEISRTCTLINWTIHSILKYYANVKPTTWNIYMTESVLISLYKLLEMLGCIYSKSKAYKLCSCFSTCKLDTDLHSAILIGNTIGDIFKLAIKQQAAISSCINQHVLHYFECCCIFIADMKNHGCIRWKEGWTSTGATIYNCGLKLYTSKNKEFDKYFILLIQNFTKFEGTKSNSFAVDILGTSLPCLAQTYMDSDQFDKALMYAALQIFFNDSASPKQWVKVKYAKRESDLKNEQFQCLTVVCVLKENENLLKRLYPDLNIILDRTTKIKLLLCELEQYKLVWPSAIATKAAFKKLYEIANLVDVVEVLLVIWPKILMYSHDDIISLLDVIFDRYQQEIFNLGGDRVDEQIHMAILHIIQYFTVTTRIKQKISANMKNTVTSKHSSLSLDEIPAHPNDECDMVPSDLYLKLDETILRLKSLDLALCLFENNISCSLSQQTYDILLKCNITTYIMMIAYEFQLHCDLLRTNRAWFVAATIAAALDDNLNHLHNISFMLAHSDVNSDTAIKLLLKSEVLKKTLEKNDEFWKVLTQFYINKSYMLLRNQKLEEGYQEYHNATKCFSNLKKDLDFLCFELELLHIHYLQLPCSFNIDGHCENILANFSKLLAKFCHKKIQDNKGDKIRPMLFQIYRSLVHMCRWMLLPREVRCYGRNIVEEAQKLALPLQTAYFLVYLAQSDLQSIRLDDCQVKLTGLADILCLRNRNNVSVTNETDKTGDTIKVYEDLSEMIENFTEITLTYPNNTKQQELSGSPVLGIEPFKLPAFVKHKSDCNCFYCVNVEYKNLILMYYNLEAELHVHRGNTALAEIYFHGAFKVYKHFLRNKDFQSNAVLGFNIFPCLKERLHQSYCSLLLSYGTYLLRLGNTKKAETTYKELITLVNEKPYENIHLYNEAHLNYTLMLLNSHCTSTKNEKESSEYDPELLGVEDCNENVKTPENKKSKIVFKVCYSPAHDSPPKRQIRKIKCNLSEKKIKKEKIPFAIFASPTNKITTDKIDATGETENSIKFACKTPIAGAVTPLLPLMTVQRTNKLVLQPIPLPSTQNDVTVNNNQWESDVVPQSPNAYTPRSIKVSTLLESKTKKLTRQIKKSTIKKISMVNDEDNINIKHDVRKNLISELNASEILQNSRKKTAVKQNTTQMEPGRSTSNIRITRASCKNKQ